MGNLSEKLKYHVTGAIERGVSVPVVAKPARYAIFDWAGNRLTRWGEFASFDDAWEFIYGKMTDELGLTEEDYQEYFVGEL